MSPTSTPVLAIEGLSVALPQGAERHYALHKVSLQVAAGEIVCLVGESGSGKSMLGNAVLGLLPQGGPQIVRGSIVFKGQDLRQLSRRAYQSLRGNRISTIFQEPMSALNPVLTIGEQIDEVIAAHRNLDKAARLQRAVELFERVRLPEPASIGRRYCHQLSGGQRQRVMIAIALANEPDLLIADEPTTALDTTTQAQVLALLKELQARMGLSVLFITHDIGVVSDIAHRVVVLRHGEVVEQGTVEQVLMQPSHAYTQALIEAVPRFVAKPRVAQAAGAPLLAVHKLYKTYQTHKPWPWLVRKPANAPTLVDINLQLQVGETLSLVGESGSGKSTLGRCIVGLNAWDQGQIQLHGRALADYPIGSVAQMVFQDPQASLNPRRKVGEIIAEPALVRGFSEQEAQQRMHDLLDLVGLGRSAAARYPHEFSGGQRQRIGLARALILRPQLLVADEPVSALDVSVQAQVLALLKDVQSELGLSMLFITHDLRVAVSISDRIAVMHQGRIVECGAAAEVMARPQSAFMRALIQASPGLHWESQRASQPLVRSAA